MPTTVLLSQLYGPGEVWREVCPEQSEPSDRSLDAGKAAAGRARKSRLVMKNDEQ